MLAAFQVKAAESLNTENPIAFFTNVASRLLASGPGVELNHIQIFPTNQYSSSVHRLLQLSANLYDSTTNRPITGEPYLPTVFRPLFRRDIDGTIWIVQYREVSDANIAEPATAPLMVDLENSADRFNIPLLGTAFDPDDQNEPMVFGVPLIIGAKKGFPNFNELAMQNRIRATRRLQFRRTAGSNTGPVIETNQMYVVELTSQAGVEAWNSYSNCFPRELRLLASSDVTMVLTNEFGQIVSSNAVSFSAGTNIPACAWPGFNDWEWLPPSLLIPLSFSNVLVAPASWVPPNQFVPANNNFIPGLGFPVPRWWLNARIRLRFAILDTSVSPARVIDYVSLIGTQPRLDVTGKLIEQNPNGCGSVLFGGGGNMWCTNRPLNSTDFHAPTYGILNQIWIGLNDNPGIPTYLIESLAGPTREQAVDIFRVNLGLSPRYYPPTTYFKSNTFYTPINPSTPIYVSCSWTANDPLIHTMGDLGRTNTVNFQPDNPDLANIGYTNPRYGPWGNGPESTHFDPSIKDPFVRRSDDWDFPSGEPLNTSTLGRIHRGTPWQTVYLKSVDVNEVDTNRWREWTGNHTTWDYFTNRVFDADLARPVMDWRIAAWMAMRLNTNQLATLFSINSSTTAWAAFLDGTTVLTNLSDGLADPFAPPEFDSIVMSSNDPQTALIANAIQSKRLCQTGRYFQNVGDILSVPELSMESPWLNLEVPGYWSYPQITDAAYEAIPRQILGRLRADSIGSLFPSNNQWRVQFTGYDGEAYRIETSTDLVHWTALNTNSPVNNTFSLPLDSPPDTGSRFYRSLLLP